ncbi:tetratricopeptide repeat protein [Pyxidicoccus xibeiensis]|uniref:tetratricopeptide repeat protein n=1 Tax=Pyxidicoccus xibeiensis TaxID=2906759 RepID=UPI0020A7789D|nr:tetratricopeptide repeat protein [Pyxidicoccus xibeiensis]MCP3142702.1 tetratricopeptide repeat protein [Pyxidicoccus xibeiensis]
MLKARLLIQLGRGAEAVAVIEALGPERDPLDEAERLLGLGLAQSAAARLQDAERTLDRAATAGADRELIDSARASLRIQEGRFAEAEKQLRDVLRRAPLLSGALYNLAVVRLQQDDVAEAAALVRQAWHAGLQDPHALKTDPDLLKLRETQGLIDDLLAAPTPNCGAW